MADDWDLFAVVRSCTNSTVTVTTSAAAEPPPPTTSSILNPARVSRNRRDPFQQDGIDPFYFPGIIDEKNDYSFQGLEEIYKELYLDSVVPSGESQQLQQVQPPPQQQQNQHSPINRRGMFASPFLSTNPHSASARPRRR